MTAAPAARLSAYDGRRVAVTGDTGFKGSWLALWLTDLGATVRGYALPAQDPSLHRLAGLDSLYAHVDGDIRDPRAVRRFVDEAAPDVVFHLAAQSLVLRGYEAPLETFETNVVGTANVLEAIRGRGAPCAVVVVTSDKCYRGDPPRGGFREDDPLGGTDPYSASKAAAEHVTAAYRRSFFSGAAAIAVATARAGNVIGGGDFAPHRLVPDVMRALGAGRTVGVRNPGHVRPWQHVLEPSSGYLELGARLVEDDRAGARFEGAWNFGPPAEDDRSVREVVETLIAEWGDGDWRHEAREGSPDEAGVLRLDPSKARAQLGWSMRWDLARACASTVAWYRAYHDGARAARLRDICRAQIAEYVASPTPGSIEGRPAAREGSRRTA